MKKIARPEKKAVCAPAYMAQYGALMTILLCFFIILLTLGKEKTGGLQSGIGDIRNTLGTIGGSGTLEFWRSMRNPGLPVVPSTPEDADNEMLIGFERTTIDHFLLATKEIQWIDFSEHRQTLLLRSPIRFEPGCLTVQRNTRFALDQVSSMLYTLKSYQVTVGVIAEEEGNNEESRLLAARRAAWLARYISDQAPESHIRSLGMARGFLKKKKEPLEQVVFFLRKIESDQDGGRTTDGNQK